LQEDITQKSEKKKNKKRSLGFCDLSAFSYHVKKKKQGGCLAKSRRGVDGIHRQAAWNQCGALDGISPKGWMESSRRRGLLCRMPYNAKGVDSIHANA